MKKALRFRKAFCGAPSGTRTQDPLIKSQLLYLTANTNTVVSNLVKWSCHTTIQTFQKKIENHTGRQIWVR